MMKGMGKGGMAGAMGGSEGFGRGPKHVAGGHCRDGRAVPKSWPGWVRRRWLRADRWPGQGQREPALGMLTGKGGKMGRWWAGDAEAREGATRPAGLTAHQGFGPDQGIVGEAAQGAAQEGLEQPRPRRDSRRRSGRCLARQPRFRARMCEPIRRARCRGVHSWQ